MGAAVGGRRRAAEAWPADAEALPADLRHRPAILPAADARPEPDEPGWVENVADLHGRLPAIQDIRTSLFTAYPRESAIMLQKTMELRVVVNSLLMVQSFAIVARHLDEAGGTARLLNFVTALRICVFIPRPIAWWRSYRGYCMARHALTPQRVARTLITLEESKPKWERVCENFFWLYSLFLPVTLRFSREGSAAMTAYGRHCKCLWLWLVFGRLIALGLFKILCRMDLDRGVQDSILNEYSSLSRAQADGTECAICFEEYEDGQALRTLRCGHCFHQGCVDPWIKKRWNRCPLCNALVGPGEKED